MTFKEIDASGAEAWLAGLREELVSKTSPAQRQEAVPIFIVAVIEANLPSS